MVRRQTPRKRTINHEGTASVPGVNAELAKKQKITHWAAGGQPGYADPEGVRKYLKRIAQIRKKP